MKQVKNVERIRDILFTLALTIEVLIVLMDKSDYIFPYPSQVFRVTFLISLVVVVLSLSQYKKKELIILAGLLALSAVSYKISGRNELLRFCMFGAACKNLDIIQKLKIYFGEIFSGSIIIGILSVTGLYGKMFSPDAEGVQRLCLGMGDSNAFHCMVLMLLVLFIYLYNDRLKWYAYVIFMIMNIALYLCTDCSSGVLGVTLLVILAALFHYTKVGEKAITYIAGISIFTAGILFSIWCACNSKDAWWNKKLERFDRFLSGRIKNLYWGTERHAGSIGSWKIFSQRDTEVYFDMGFVRLFYWYGWIPALIICFLIIVLFYKAMKRKDKTIVPMLIVLSIYTVVEAHLVSVYIGRNFVLLIMAMYFLNYHEGMKRDEQQ
ncbi:hypothetical protein [Butyrivibrio sp. NC3005]|uniref:hypothetical protein n=1 Tax=Butyrivibrio sp. NC3005 TaxID=1280685 RepID=UPI00047A9F70|nr:hypothetical protein [Butyrivibrio sp. NC3005]